MDQWAEYALIFSLFIIFASVASLGALAYGRHFSPEAKLLRARLKQIETLRQTDGLHADSESSQKKGDGALAEFIAKLSNSESLNSLIVSSGTKLRPIDVFGMVALLAALGLIIAIVISPKNLLGGLLLMAIPAIFASGPFIFLQQKANWRRKKFDDKFPEALGLMARSLQAGSGLTSAIGMAAGEVPEPCGTEFKKAFDEINFGIPFNDAISNMSNRVKSQDLNFFVTALLIQRETGGNLAELLNSLAHTIRDRQKLARKVRIISAEGRLSGNVLIAMPFLMVGLLTLINPKYIGLLFTTPQGQTAVYFGLTMMVIGALLIRRIVNIKV